MDELYQIEKIEFGRGGNKNCKKKKINIQTILDRRSNRDRNIFLFTFQIGIYFKWVIMDKYNSHVGIGIIVVLL